VLNYTETRKLPFKVALDSGGDLAKAFGDVAMTPTTFVIGKDGKILKRYLGEPDFAGAAQTAGGIAARIRQGRRRPFFLAGLRQVQAALLFRVEHSDIPSTAYAAVTDKFLLGNQATKAS
jgi:hypothetical protein